MGRTNARLGPTGVCADSTLVESLIAVMEASAELISIGARSIDGCTLPGGLAAGSELVKISGCIIAFYGSIGGSASDSAQTPLESARTFAPNEKGIDLVVFPNVILLTGLKNTPIAPYVLPGHSHLPHPLFSALDIPSPANRRRSRGSPCRQHAPSETEPSAEPPVIPPPAPCPSARRLR